MGGSSHGDQQEAQAVEDDLAPRLAFDQLALKGQQPSRILLFNATRRVDANPLLERRRQRCADLPPTVKQTMSTRETLFGSFSATNALAETFCVQIQS
jgi:hypothetical protein